MPILLVLIAMGLGAFGAMALTQATLGVGLICIGCLAGILGRISQAYEHHKKMMNRP